MSVTCDAIQKRLNGRGSVYGKDFYGGPRNTVLKGVLISHTARGGALGKCCQLYANSAFHLSGGEGVGKLVPTSAGEAKAGMVHSLRG